MEQRTTIVAETRQGGQRLEPQRESCSRDRDQRHRHAQRRRCTRYSPGWTSPPGRPPSSIRPTGLQDEHRLLAIELGEDLLEVRDLRQVVDHDVAGARVPDEIILMIRLGRIEYAVRFD